MIIIPECRGEMLTACRWMIGFLIDFSTMTEDTSVKFRRLLNQSTRIMPVPLFYVQKLYLLRKFLSVVRRAKLDCLSQSDLLQMG